MSTVDPLDPTKPVNSDKVKQAFDELRALKLSVNERIADLIADLESGTQNTVRVAAPDILAELPLAALRINKVLFFGATGQPVLLNLGAVTGTPSLIPENGSITTAKFAAGAKSPLAGVADSLATAYPFASLAGKPTTLGGYGITDASNGGELSGLKITTTGVDANITVDFSSVVLTQFGATNPLAVGVRNTAPIVRATANLDTGAVAASTWYAIWYVYKVSDGTQDVFLSLNGALPSLAGGWTHGKRLGWIRTDSTGNAYPLAMIQTGNRVSYKPTAGSNVLRFPLIASGVAGNPISGVWVGYSVADVVPTTASEIKSGLASYGLMTIIAAPSNTYGAYDSLTAPPPMGLSVAASGRQIASADLHLESSNIYYACDSANGQLFCRGWTDNL